MQGNQRYLEPEIGTFRLRGEVRPRPAPPKHEPRPAAPPSRPLVPRRALPAAATAR